MAHAFREPDLNDVSKLADLRAAFTAESEKGLTYAAYALSEAMGDIIDCLMDRDCDGDRRICPIVFNPQTDRVLVVAPVGPRPDFETDDEILAEIGRINQSLPAAHLRSQEIITEALGVLARADHRIERGTLADTAIAPPVEWAFDMAFTLASKRMLEKGILTSDSDGWPELDPDFITDIQAIFSALRGGFPEMAEHVLVVRDRKNWEEFLHMPIGPVIGRAEMAVLRSAIQEASQLILKPIERANQLHGMWHLVQQQYKRANERDRLRVALRAELGEIEGLTDGLSPAAGTAIRLWIEEGTPFPIRPDTKDPTKLRNQVIEELIGRFGEKAWEKVSTALHGQGDHGIDALRAFVRAAKAHISGTRDAPEPM